jgi:hypothetical protein
MTIWFYVKTKDDSKTVGDVVCAFNYTEGIHPNDKYSWIMQESRDEPGSWEIWGKYAGLKDLTEIGLVYRIGDTVVLSEFDNDLAPNLVDPLITKYGFDNVKWIVVPTIS